MNLGPISKAELKKLRHMASRSKYARIHNRIKVVLLGIEGRIAREIASKLDKNIRWVQMWAARFRDEGIKGLFDYPKSGAPMKLSHENHDSFSARVKEGPLSEDEVSIFHGKDFQRILKEEFKCDYSLSGVYALLHRLRFSWITSRPVHEKNDPEVMKAWIEENPRIFAEVKKNHPGKKIEWWFFDESRYGQQGNLYRNWAETNTRPRKVKQMGFESCYALGTINPVSGEKAGLIFSTLDTDVMNVFLSEFKKVIPGSTHVILVLDGAGYHRGKALIVPENITLRYLPPYSPELNPIERLWKWLKEHHLGNTISKGIKELFQRGVNAWEKVTRDLVQSLCSVNWILT